jgi:hypothetical protein
LRAVADYSKAIELIDLSVPSRRPGYKDDPCVGPPWPWSNEWSCTDKAFHDRLKAIYLVGRAEAYAAANDLAAQRES